MEEQFVRLVVKGVNNVLGLIHVQNVKLRIEIREINVFAIKDSMNRTPHQIVLVNLNYLILYK